VKRSPQEISLQLDALIAAIDELRKAGAPDEKIYPLYEIITDLCDTHDPEKRRRRPHGERYNLGVAAAAVTALRRGGGVDRAIAEVAKLRGLSCKELREARDRLHRGQADGTSAHAYKQWLKLFQTETKEDIVRQLRWLP
jgi:hypothetical protein